MIFIFTSFVRPWWRDVQGGGMRICGGGGGLFVPSERYCTLKASDSHFVPTWARKLRNCEKRPGNEIAQACSQGAEEAPGNELVIWSLKMKLLIFQAQNGLFTEELWTLLRTESNIISLYFFIHLRNEKLFVSVLGHFSDKHEWDLEKCWVLELKVLSCVLVERTCIFPY